MVDKKGWIKILEAFLAGSLLLIVLLQVSDNSNQVKKPNEILKNKVSNILFELKSNQTYRSKILINNGGNIPPEINNYFNEKENCGMCIENICTEEVGEKEIYSMDSLIFSDYNHFNPKKIKVFCYEKV